MDEEIRELEYTLKTGDHFNKWKNKHLHDKPRLFAFAQQLF